MMLETRSLTGAASAACAALLLGGCAAMSRLDNEVSTYSQWPAQRPAASYVFERLPSQQSRPEEQQRLEDAARPAVNQAGFVAAADPAGADFSIQLGARTQPNQASPFDDPFWWPGGLHYGFGYGRFGRGFWPGAGWYGGYSRSYEREVAVMIRDRKTGQVLYEARANNDGTTPSFDGMLPAMFEAALKDFPNPGINPRRVTVDLAKKPAS